MPRPRLIPHKTVNDVLVHLKADLKEAMALDYGVDENMERKRWKRAHSNQPGVYDVKLNINQVQIINDALKKVSYQAHLKKHWSKLYEGIINDMHIRGYITTRWTQPKGANGKSTSNNS